MPCIGIPVPRNTKIANSMAFSFGFSGDDIKEDPNDAVPQTQEASVPGDDGPPPIAARTHDLDELVGVIS